MLKTAIIIPAYNEERIISACLETYISQTVRPDLVLIIDDNSSDKTFEIVSGFNKLNPWIRVLRFQSEARHLPGEKVVNAFNFGLSSLKASFDLIGKFDADILLPGNYFETVQKAFERDPKLGLCSGLLYIKRDEKWVYESIASKEHVRGPVKLYRQSCIEAMGGLRPGLGWDTADTILLQYYGFKMLTLTELKVKHLRPTGSSYSNSTAINQGRGYRNMRYGLAISIIASLKMAWRKGSLSIVWNSLRGYSRASKDRLPYLVTSEEGRYVRKHRWKMMGKKLF